MAFRPDKTFVNVVAGIVIILILVGGGFYGYSFIVFEGFSGPNAMVYADEQLFLAIEDRIIVTDDTGSIRDQIMFEKLGIPGPITGMVMLDKGRLLLADSSSGRVMALDLASMKMDDWVEQDHDSPGVIRLASHPRGVLLSWVDSQTIWLFDQQGGFIEEVLGEESLNYPNATAWLDGLLLVANTNHHRVSVFDDDYREMSLAFDLQDAPVRNGRVWPTWVEMGPNGKVWVVAQNNRLQDGDLVFFDPEGEGVWKVDLPQEIDPFVLEVVDDRLLLSDMVNPGLWVLDANGTLLGSLGEVGSWLGERKECQQFARKARLWLIPFLLIGLVGVVWLDKLRQDGEDEQLVRPPVRRRWGLSGKVFTYRPHIFWMREFVPVLILVVCLFMAYLVHRFGSQLPQIWQMVGMFCICLILALEGGLIYYFFGRLIAISVRIDGDQVTYRNHKETKTLAITEIHKLSFPSVRFGGGWISMETPTEKIRLTVVVGGISRLLTDLKVALDRADNRCYDPKKFAEFLKLATYSDESWDRFYLFFKPIALAALGITAVSVILGFALGFTPVGIAMFPLAGWLCLFLAVALSETNLTRKAYAGVDLDSFTYAIRDVAAEKEVYAKGAKVGLVLYGLVLLIALLNFVF